MLDDLANSLGDDINFEQSTPGGETLEGHSTYPVTINKINQTNWDYVILQGQSQRSALSPAYVSTNVTPFAQQLVNMIESNSSCSEPIFFMTWGRKYGDQSYCAFYPPVCTFDGMQARLRDSYLNLPTVHSLVVVYEVRKKNLQNYLKTKIVLIGQHVDTLN